MTKILMVCLGNICRSPLAHGILESKLNDSQYIVDSAGTAAYHVGQSPDHRSIEVAKQHGIDISHQRARQFIAEDFEQFDLIYAMDQSNYNNIISLTANPSDIQKVKLILDENYDIINKNVPDPYYGDFSDFEYVFELLNSTCGKIVDKLKP
ncbi:MAG: low molecular weight protein-tyrosine-phosphatase [Bacteroidota bacterium]